MSSPIHAEITLTDVASMLGISRQHVHNLVRDGFIAKTASGRVVIAEAAQGYRKSLLREKVEKTVKAQDEGFRAVRSQEIALRIAERSGRMVKEANAEAMAVIDEYAGALRAGLSAVPANSTEDIATRRRIEDSIDAVFAELAARVEREAGRSRTARRDLDASPKVNTRRVGSSKPRVSGKHRKARAA